MVVMYAYIKKNERSQIYFTLQGTKKEEQMKSKVSRRKEITKIGEEIREVRKTKK